ncbi:MAG: hypothetical protein N3A57_03275 [Negativicutes bacterium]|nr:hypothetical protein [Negativicutes bacterium]
MTAAQLRKAMLAVQLVLFLIAPGHAMATSWKDIGIEVGATVLVVNSQIDSIEKKTTPPVATISISSNATTAWWTTAG